MSLLVEVSVDVEDVQICHDNQLKVTMHAQEMRSRLMETCPDKVGVSKKRRCEGGG